MFKGGGGILSMTVQVSVLFSLAIWRSEHTLSGWPEHAVPWRNDTRLDDTWYRGAGYEEDWPSKKYPDGHEA